eukprot:TRINITY_DN4167_c0_g1_i1.p1 TRINITY_DN4167_c0_g1~~TRINITY_DN4167_c0_g1_i1.p1  ORF type:complete len:670 (-),score=80.83 TRINITY_DN4167_c0_g1_i1:90-2099(-)
MGLMSGRPKRASAVAAQAYIDARVKRRGVEDDEEQPERSSKRQRSNDKAEQEPKPTTEALPVLPSELYGLIMCFSYTLSTRLKDFLELRTVSKSWAAATSFQSGDFWRRLSERFMRTASSAELQKIVRKYYNDDWFHFSRCCLASCLALPSFKGNPRRTGFVAPYVAPTKPHVRWVFRHGEQNGKVPIAPLSFSTWGDRGVFLTQDQTVVCLDLATGNEIWSQKLSADAQRKDSYAMHDFSLEIRVVPSADVPPNAPHLDFFEARSVVCLCNQQTLVSLDIKTGAIQWRVDAEKDFGATFWGGIVVLPHGCMVTLREHKAPHECFAVMFGDSASVLWKTSLESPGMYGMGPPAVDLSSGLCVVPIGVKHASGQIDYIVLRIMDGHYLSKMPDAPETDTSEDAWAVDTRFMLEGEDVIVSMNPEGQAVHVESRNVFTGKRRILVANENMSQGEDHEEEFEQDESEDSEEPKEPKKGKSKPKKGQAKAVAKKQRAYDAEFSMEMCLDHQRGQTLLPGCWAGGGGAFDTALFSVDRRTRKTTWIRDESDAESGEWKKAFGVSKMRRVSLYGLVYGIPLCDAEGNSVWPTCGGDTRSLLVLDANGVPKVYCDLRATDESNEDNGSDDEDESLLRSGLDDDFGNISASVVRLARVNGRNFVLFCTYDWIWAASD